MKYTTLLGALGALLCAFTSFANDDREPPKDGFEASYVPYAERDLAGLKRDSMYFMGYQLATVGILYFMPEGVSGWDDEAREEYSLGKWWDNVQNPHWDSDDHYLNYILHPYWGAAYYVRARERGFEKRDSVIYSAFMSTLFEFGVEALFEQPSIQDLITTPLGGYLFGEYMYRVHREIRDRHAGGAIPTTKDRLLLIATDPLGMLNNKVDDIFRRETEFSMRTFVTHPGNVPALSGFSSDHPFDYSSGDKMVGVHFKIRF